MSELYPEPRDHGPYGGISDGLGERTDTDPSDLEHLVDMPLDQLQGLWEQSIASEDFDQAAKYQRARELQEARNADTTS